VVAGSSGPRGHTLQYFAWATWDSAFYLLVDIIIIIAPSLVLQIPQIYS
jgi:hypothetical protein